MGNVLGLLVVILGVLGIITYNLTGPISKGVERFRSVTGKWKTRLELHLVVRMAGPLAYLLIFLGGVTGAITLKALSSLIIHGISSWFTVVTVLLLGVLISLGEVLYGIYMLSGRPKFLEEDGGPKEHPLYLRNEDGDWLNDDETLITYTPNGDKIKLDKQGRALRYYKNTQSIWRDAKRGTPLFAHGRPMQFNAAGFALRYTQHPQETWWDEETNTALAAAPVNPEEIWASAPAVNLEEALSEEDKRVDHPLAGLPIVDEQAANRNKFGRVLITRTIVGIFAVGIVFGLSLIGLGLANGDPKTYQVGIEEISFVSGNTELMDLGAIVFVITMAFVIAFLSIGAWIFVKGSKALEFILSTGVGEALLVLIQFTKDNLRGIFQGVDLVNEERIGKKIKRAGSLPLQNFILFYTIARLCPVASFASFVLLLMVLQGAWDWHYAQNQGENEIVISQQRLSRFLWRNIKWVYILVALLSAWTSIHLPILEQSLALLHWTEDFASGLNLIRLFSPGSCVGLIAVSAVLFITFSVFSQKIGKKDAGWFQKLFGNIHGVTALLFSLPAILGGVGLLMTLMAPNDAKAVGLPKTASVIAAEAKLVPAKPTELKLLRNGDGWRLEWKGNNESKTTTYRVQWRNEKMTVFIDSREPEVGFGSYTSVVHMFPDTINYFRVVAKNEYGESVSEVTQPLEIPPASAVATPVVTAAASNEPPKPQTVATVEKSDDAPHPQEYGNSSSGWKKLVESQGK